MLNRNAPLVRPDVGGLTQAFKGRYVGLTILDRCGVHKWEGLPVLAFAMPPAANRLLTPIYSFRLSENFTQNAHYLDDLRHVTRPMVWLAGADDEFFYAEKFAPLAHGVRPDISVGAVPNAGHMGVVVNPQAIEQVVATLGGKLG